MNRYLIFTLTCVITLLCCQQNKKNKAVNKTAETSYTLPYPQGVGYRIVFNPYTICTAN